ncbi:cytochrome P450 89A9-like [Silene latifolia]|uniref:cytochrome P450 89A9-like n=1 Tax=Silene latifolia TaxID=37657 RepID=UPI003D7737E2
MEYTVYKATKFIDMIDYDVVIDVDMDFFPIHEIYVTQYRAMFVVNCEVKEKTMRLHKAARNEERRGKGERECWSNCFTGNEDQYSAAVTFNVTGNLKALIDILPKKSQIDSERKPQFPPGISISPATWLLKYSSFHGPLPLVKRLRSKLGPIFTIYVGSRPTIWISDAFLAHEALIKNGSMSADRLKAPPTNSIFNSNQHSVSSAAYGPTWQALRRNLASHFLSPTHISSFAGVRKWALDILIHRLEDRSKSGDPIQLRDHLLHSIFRLQCAMCFGLFLDEAEVKEVQSISRRILLGLPHFSILNAWPKLTKIIFATKWAEIHTLRKKLDDVFVRLIKTRKKLVESEKEKIRHCYVDSLLELQIPNEEGGLRNLTAGEMVSLCNEFINASTDLPSTDLEWAMANLVKYPQIQAQLLREIKEVVGSRPNTDEIRDEDLAQIPYLKAVILEVLRRHPSGHLLLPHRIEQDMELGGYTIPKDSWIKVLVAEIGWDPNVWEDPMKFNPERFLTNDALVDKNFDLAGRKEIKMMPFGVGRRMCPGHVLTRLNLEYFVANLVWRFEWKAGEQDVDLSEETVFTIMMKNPLEALVSSRSTQDLVD